MVCLVAHNILLEKNKMILEILFSSTMQNLERVCWVNTL